jgi:hypothetical protein
MVLDTLVSYIRGIEGSRVSLSIKRPRMPSLINFSIKRAPSSSFGNLLLQEEQDTPARPHINKALRKRKNYGPIGYKDLEWGALKENVVAKYGPIVTTTTPKGCYNEDSWKYNTYNVIKGVPDGPIEERWFYFINDSLFRVIVFYRGQEDNNTNAKDLLANLVTDYGEPVLTSSNPEQTSGTDKGLFCSASCHFNYAAYFEFKETRIVYYATSYQSILGYNFYNAVVSYWGKSIIPLLSLKEVFPETYRTPQRIEK